MATISRVCISRCWDVSRMMDGHNVENALSESQHTKEVTILCNRGLRLALPPHSQTQRPQRPKQRDTCRDETPVCPHANTVQVLEFSSCASG